MSMLSRRSARLCSTMAVAAALTAGCAGTAAPRDPARLRVWLEEKLAAGEAVRVETAATAALAQPELQAQPELVAEIALSLAHAQAAQGRNEAARNAFATATTLAETAYGKDAAETARFLAVQADFLFVVEENNPDAALLYRRAHEILQRVRPEGHADVVRLVNAAGAAYARCGSFDLALPYHRLAVAAAERTPESGLAELGVALHNLGLTLAQMQNFHEAASVFERCLAVRLRSLPSGHPDMAMAYGHLATAYSELGRVDRAEPLFERALNLHQENWAKEHPALKPADYATTLYALALMRLRQKRWGEAETLLLAVLKIREASLPSGDLAVLRTARDLGDLCRDRGQPDRAASFYQLALQHAETRTRERDKPLSSALSDLSGLHVEQKEYDLAIGYLEREREIYLRHPADMGHETQRVSTNLRIVYDWAGRYAEAVSCAEDLVSHLEKTTGPSEFMGQTILAVAVLHIKTGALEKAAESYRKAQKVFEEIDSAASLATTLRAHAKLLEAMERAEEAEPLLRRAAALDP